jgi:peptide/nickel transport system ATP-binding protein
MTAPLLSVRDLRVEFTTRRGTLTALDGISFDIAAGEVLGMVGESGAGKSLTGAAIIGLLEPPGRIAGGEIRLRGERIDNLPPEAMRRIRGKRIGMVFQDPLTSLNPLYTVAQQLTETIRTHADVSEAEARKPAPSLLDRVGIPAAARGSTIIRTISRAACGSGWSSRWRCARNPSWCWRTSRRRRSMCRFRRRSSI